MKIAYTLNGLFGGFVGINSSNKSSSDSELVMRYTYLKLKKYILENHGIDLFIFSWHVDLENQIIECMRPTGLELCKQIDFEPFDHLKHGNVARVKSHISRWYGFQQVMNMVRDYEIGYNFKYDLVVNARMDLCWNKPFDFSKLDNTKFHIAHNKDLPNWGWPNANPEITDHIFASNSDTMFEYSNLYDKLHEYTLPGQCPQYATISNHFLMVWHLRKMNILNEKIISKTLTTMDIGVDPDVNYHIFRKMKITRDQVKDKL